MRIKLTDTNNQGQKELKNIELHFIITLIYTTFTFFFGFPHLFKLIHYESSNKNKNKLRVILLLF